MIKQAFCYVVVLPFGQKQMSGMPPPVQGLLS